MGRIRLCLSLLLIFNLFAEGQYMRASIPRDFPDPSVIYAEQSWWAYSTSGGGKNVPVAKSADFNGGWSLLNSDALPVLPNWVNPVLPEIWAPNVIQPVSVPLFASVQ
jgi:hypothetical protein